VGLALVALAACSGSPSGHPKPPTAFSLAAKLGCHVSGPDDNLQWAYDTIQYVDAHDGPCTNGVFDTVIITFSAQAKEDDWLHQNVIEESSSFPAGYDELVVGHLWAIGQVDGAAPNLGYVTSILGGKDTTF